MAQLSVSSAWDEATRFGAREFGLLYPVALLLLELPSLLVALIAPRVETTGMLDPAAMVEAVGVGTFILVFVVLGLVVFALQTLGGLTISLLALRPGTSVGEALSISAGRLPALFAAILLVGLALTIAMAPFFLLLAGSLGTTPSAGGAAAGIFFALLFVILLAAIFTRLTLMTPVAAVERLGPVGIISRSWRLTAGHFWKIFGAFILIFIVYLIVASAISFIFLLLIRALMGPLEASTTAVFVYELLTSLFTAAIAVFFITFVARLYAQLSGRREEIGEVFS